MTDDLLLRAAERKIGMNDMRDDRPGSATSWAGGVVPNEQTVNERGRTTLFKDQIRLCVSYLAAFAAVLKLLNVGAKG